MNKKTIIFVIILASLSLIGIAVTQFFWVRNAMHLKEEQVNHRIRIALRAVEDQIHDLNKDTVKLDTPPHLPPHFPPHFPPPEEQNLDLVRPAFLDSAIKEEFTSLNINMDFKYGVYRKSDKYFKMGDYNGFKNEIINSNHCISLTCSWKPDSYFLGVYFPKEKNMLFVSMAGWILLSALFLIVFVVSFTYAMLSLLRQKKLSEMKTDFVNNMTHEFKTPISTISLASEMLLKPRVNESREKTKKYANIIYDENSRLKNQVEQVLQIAVLDKGNFKLKKKEVNLHEVIELAVDNFEMLVKQRCGKIITYLDASMATFYADPVHITNIIHNLMDNANKYSPETPEITITTRNTEKGIILTVEG